MTTMSNTAWHELGCTCLYPVQFGHTEQGCKFKGHDRHAIPEGCTPEWVEAVDEANREAIRRWANSPEQVKARREFAAGLWASADNGSLQFDVLDSAGPHQKGDQF